MEQPPVALPVLIVMSAHPGDAHPGDAQLAQQYRVGVTMCVVVCVCALVCVCMLHA